MFYVGKGKRSRPYQHLHDALKVSKCMQPVSRMMLFKSDECFSMKLQVTSNLKKPKPALSLNPHERVLHDLVIVDDRQETKQLWIAKQDDV